MTTDNRNFIHFRGFNQQFETLMGILHSKEWSKLSSALSSYYFLHYFTKKCAKNLAVQNKFITHTHTHTHTFASIK